MKKKLYVQMLFLVLLCFTAINTVYAANEKTQQDITVFNLELEKILNLGTALLALILASLTFLSFKRTGKQRLLFVTIAFGLFAFKMLMIGSEMFFGEFPLVDQISSIMDFVILLTFFLGIIKK